MDKKIILYIIVFVIITSLIILTFFPNIGYVVKDFGSSENREDLCSPPEGTSEEEWIEHMSHHPNMYKECLR